MKKLPIGISDFNRIIKDEYIYIDKTLLLKELIDQGAMVSLFPRPRRFGKTLTMSMIDNYFNINYKEEYETKDIFDGLNIANEGEKYREYKNNYPVIFISLKDIKADSWQEEYKMLEQLMSIVYREHAIVKKVLNEEELIKFDDILKEKASLENMKNSLLSLTKYLERYYNQKVILLIDEYDGLIEKSFTKNFYVKCIDFMKIFLSSTLKDNKSLMFSVITGILKISKESLFSGLNNLMVYSILNDKYGEYFGFEQNEVEKILEEYNLESKMQDVENWYNGYKFGNKKIYNPWSILNFLIRDGEFDCYWVNTSGNELIQEILSLNKEENFEFLKKILNNEKILTSIDDNMIYDNINSGIDSVCSFLLMAGYLTIHEKIERLSLEDDQLYELKVPNIEVKKEFNNIIKKWFIHASKSNIIFELQRTLVLGEIEQFSEKLNKLLVWSSSSFDSNESFYHGVMFMLLSSFGENFIVESNKEAGYGRYDLKLKKKDNSFGCIFEFKFAKKEEDLEKSAIEAFNQIKDKEYYQELLKDEVKNIKFYGISFRNKKAKIYYERKG